MKIFLQAKKATSAKAGLIYSFVAMIEDGKGRYKFIDLDETYDFTHDPFKAMFEFIRLAEKYCDSEPSITAKNRVKKIEEILDLEEYKRVLEKEDEDAYQLKEDGRKYRKELAAKEERKRKRKKPTPAKKVYDLDSMKVRELRKLAKEHNIKLSRECSTKKDIVALLKEQL